MQASGNKPNTILSDFELAAINSVSATFPNVDISGCFNHLCSYIWKIDSITGLAGALQLMTIKSLPFRYE